MGTLMHGKLANLVSKFENVEMATLLANVVTVVQEWMAVTFQLVCLSRLEATADVKSLLVLFMTLVVFTGPYLNAWLLFADYIFFKDWSPSYMIGENIGVGILISASHVAGAVTAKTIVNAWQENSKSTITWDTLADTTVNDVYVGVHFVEEMFAVSSLLIGCVYLLWLRKIKKDKPEKEHEVGIPKIEITFYWQLTLLVAAVSQAFPSAYLSPHILCYKRFMGQITNNILFSRLGGGAVGLLISSMWVFCRVNYRNGIQNALDPQHAHAYSAVANSASGSNQTRNVNPLNPRAQLPILRLSMQGNSYL